MRQGCADREAWDNIVNLQESWSKGSQAVRWLATVFSVTLCF